MFRAMNPSLLSLIGPQVSRALLDQAVEVPLGTTRVSSTEPLFTTVGASVAVCLLDTAGSASALRQVMLPPVARGHRQDAMMSADAAMEDVLTNFLACAGLEPGSPPGGRVCAKLFGGATLPANSFSYSDGQQTAAFVHSWLSTRRIPVAAESLGGNARRELVLLPERGVVYCRRLPLDEAFLAEERDGLSTDNHTTANKIELF